MNDTFSKYFPNKKSPVRLNLLRGGQGFEYILTIWDLPTAESFVMKDLNLLILSFFCFFDRFFRLPGFVRILF